MKGESSSMENIFQSEHKILVVAKSQRQIREFLTLMNIGKRSSPNSFPIDPEKLQSIDDYGLHLKAGVVMEKTAVNLSQLTNHMTIAFQLKLIGEGSGQVFQYYERDIDTATMLSGIINELGDNDDRKCRYVCEMVMAFPKWAITDWRMPPMVTVTESLKGSIIKGSVERMFGIQTLTNERLDLKHSNLLMDHVFIPDSADAKEGSATLGVQNVKHRYLIGVLGECIQDLVVELHKYTL